MATILIVGPDKKRTTGIRSLLREDGHHVRVVRESEAWRQAERDVLPELIVAAVPSTEAVISVRGRPMRGFPAPLLFIQNEGDFAHDLHMEERLVDRLESPFMSEELLGRVDALIRVRRVVLRVGRAPGRNDDDSDDEPANGRRFSDVAGRITAFLGRRVPRYAKPLVPYMEVAARLADWADRRDGFEPGHAERVASYCSMMADSMHLSNTEATALLRAAMLHDMGKVAVPVEILRHHGPLAESQMRLVRTHPQRGAAILRALDRDEDVARTILYHHENVDGTGYYGKSEGNIPKSARILAVAECFDAMLHSRVREPLAAGAALERIEEDSGSKFDPDCVRALRRALRPRRHRIPVSTL